MKPGWILLVAPAVIALPAGAQEEVALTAEKLPRGWKLEGATQASPDEVASIGKKFVREHRPPARRRGVLLHPRAHPPRLCGIPYVDVTAPIRVKNVCRPGGERLSADLTRATARWPSDKAGDIVKQATGSAKAPREKVDALPAWSFGEIRFDGKVTGSRYGVEQVLKQKYGHCWDKSDVFVTLCRSAGIPARQVAGWVPALKAGHVWTEVYLDGEGWLPVDATTPWTGTSDDYVPWFSTSDGEMPVVYLSWPDVQAKE